MAIDWFATALLVVYLWCLLGFAINVALWRRLPRPTRGDAALFIVPFVSVAAFYASLALPASTLSTDVYVLWSRTHYVLLAVAATNLNRHAYRYIGKEARLWMTRLFLSARH